MSLRARLTYRVRVLVNFPRRFFRLGSCQSYLFHAAFLCALESGENELALGVVICFAASNEEGKQACRIRFLFSAYMLNTLPYSLDPILHLLVSRTLA